MKNVPDGPLTLEGDLSLDERCNFLFHTSTGWLGLNEFLSNKFPILRYDDEMIDVRLIFIRQSNPSSVLELQGALGISGRDINFESASVSNWLEKIFMQHFFPNSSFCEELDEAVPRTLGHFKVTIELLGKR